MLYDWYIVFKEPQLETKSKAYHNAIYNLSKEKQQNKKLSDITTADFQKLINEYGKTHVKSSVFHIKNIISSFVKYTVDEDCIFNKNKYL